MGIALMTFSALFSGLASLSASAIKPSLPQHTQAPLSVGRGHTLSRPPQRPRSLRVLRVAELDNLPQCAGRMVISGCMADVCAELDRLAAIEARQAHVKH